MLPSLNSKIMFMIKGISGPHLSAEHPSCLQVRPQTHQLIPMYFLTAQGQQKSHHEIISNINCFELRRTRILRDERAKAKRKRHSRSLVMMKTFIMKK